MFEDTITLFHSTVDGYVKSTIDDVYFEHNKKSNVIDKGIKGASSGCIIIPFDIATINNNNVSNTYIDSKRYKGNGWTIEDNDYIIAGKVEEEFDIRVLTKKYQVFKVLSVDDNLKGNLEHLKIGVGE
ncbi:MAG: DUF6751 family protein [Clostridia bacterium]